MGAVPSAPPSYQDGPHHPSCCWHRDFPSLTLDENGTLACPHGEASEQDVQWMARRNEFVCKLLMEVVTRWEAEGWPFRAAVA